MAQLGSDLTVVMRALVVTNVKRFNCWSSANLYRPVSSLPGQSRGWNKIGAPFWVAATGLKVSSEIWSRCLSVAVSEPINLASENSSHYHFSRHNEWMLYFVWPGSRIVIRWAATDNFRGFAKITLAPRLGNLRNSEG
jgi:hypothetical protein